MGLVFRAWPCASAARLVLWALACPDKPPSAAATSRAHTVDSKRCTVWLRCLLLACAILLVLAGTQRQRRLTLQQRAQLWLLLCACSNCDSRSQPLFRCGTASAAT